MEIERAMEILDPEHREQYDSLATVQEACRMGMEALRLHIPMKIQIREVGGVKYYECGNCGSPLRYKVNFCSNCGQGALWND